MAILYRSRLIDGREHFECPVTHFDRMKRIADSNPKAPMPVECGAPIFGGKGSRQPGMISHYEKRELNELIDYWLATPGRCPKCGGEMRRGLVGNECGQCGLRANASHIL